MKHTIEICFPCGYKLVSKTTMGFFDAGYYSSKDTENKTCPLHDKKCKR